MNSKEEYRTEEQFKKIVNNAINGNWKDAFKKAEKYGFYANDLIRANENAQEMGGSTFTDLTDIALISEGAEKLRK